MKYLCRDKKSLDKYFFILEENMVDYARKHDRLPVIYYKSGKSGNLCEVSRDESDKIWGKYDNKKIEKLGIKPNEYGFITNEDQIRTIINKINELVDILNQEAV